VEAFSWTMDEPFAQILPLTIFFAPQSLKPFLIGKKLPLHMANSKTPGRIFLGWNNKLLVS
jgi:hypothetical protein